MELEKIFDETLRLLTSYGYTVEKISYPEDHDKRSIDIVASHVERKPLMLKITDDTSNLKASEINELRDCSSILGAAGLIVANKDNSDEIDDIVAHEKSGVFVVSPRGLKSTLDNTIYVVKRQGNYYMRVDGEKLRAEREKRGYGLGDVASLLGVSRRAVYMYEREEVDVSLQTALRLMDVFSDEIFKPIDILEEEQTSQSQQRVRRMASSRLTKLTESIKNLGGEIIETRRAPSDAVARIDSEKMVIVLSTYREKIFFKKLVESAKVASHVNARTVAILRSISRQIVEDEIDLDKDFDTYRSIDEFVKEIKLRQRA
jgi:putative transcriptional regulator